MVKPKALRCPEQTAVETPPVLCLMADAAVRRSGGYIGVRFRYAGVNSASGLAGKELRESHFLMSSAEACDLRDLLDQVLARRTSVAYH